MTYVKTPLKILRDSGGASLVEFGLIAPLLFLMLLGFFDLAHWFYVRSIAVGAIESVARSAGVGGASVDPTVFEQQVEAEIRNVSKQATFTWDKKSYYQFSGIGKPEKLVTDLNGNGKYDPGDCWEDLNPNGVYDTNPGRSGVGGADDIVFYQLTVAFPPIIDVSKFLPFNSGMGGPHTTTVNTIVRRQPFAAQVPPAVRC